MARPKLGETETERLHVKIAAEEVTSIDDWRYANRIPSRSEAVRRLVQIGLIFDSRVDALSNQALQAMEAIVKALGNIADDEKDALPLNVHGALITAMEEQEKLTGAIIETHNAVFPFSNSSPNEDFQTILEKSERQIAAFRNREAEK